MTKSEALALFDGNRKWLASAVGVTLPRISQWPKKGPLPDRDSDRVVGAAIRLGFMRNADGQVIRVKAENGRVSVVGM